MPFPYTAQFIFDGYDEGSYDNVYDNGELLFHRYVDGSWDTVSVDTFAFSVSSWWSVDYGRHVLAQNCGNTFIITCTHDTGYTLVYRSQDGGNTWEQLDNLNYYVTWLEYANGVFVAIIEEEAKLFVSEDLGETWAVTGTDFPTKLYDSWDSFHATDQMISYDDTTGSIHFCALTYDGNNDDNYHHVKTDDLGETWSSEQLVGIAEYSFPAGIAANDGHVVIGWADDGDVVGDGAKIWATVSHDDGDTWEAAASVTPLTNVHGFNEFVIYLGSGLVMDNTKVTVFASGWFGGIDSYEPDPEWEMAGVIYTNQGASFDYRASGSPSFGLPGWISPENEGGAMCHIFGGHAQNQAEQHVGLATDNVVPVGCEPPPPAPSYTCGTRTPTDGKWRYHFWWTSLRGYHMDNGGDIVFEDVYHRANQQGPWGRVPPYEEDGKMMGDMDSGMDFCFYVSKRMSSWRGAVFIAGGEGYGGDCDTIAYSQNGVDWTEVIGSGAILESVMCLAHNGIMWIAGGDSGMAYSYGGISWTFIPDSADILSSINGIAWSSDLGVWVAVGHGSNDNIMYSSDGFSWTGAGRIFEGVSGVGFCVTEGDGIFIAGGYGYPGYYDGGIYRSTNGIDWTYYPSQISWYVIALMWDGNKFIAGGFGNTNQLSYSTDGTTWIGLGEPFGHKQIQCLVFNEEDYLAGIYDYGSVYTLGASDDGLVWTGPTTLFEDATDSIAWGRDLWIAGGDAGYGDDNYCIKTSDDGVTWTDANDRIFVETEYGYSRCYVVAYAEPTDYGIVLADLFGPRVWMM